MKISIITINLNDCKGLSRTIESVSLQENKHFQHIIIDGGSTDGSVDYIEKKGESFSYWVSEPDGGIYSAMNKGLKRAEGEYCLFLNSGDVLFSNTVIGEILRSRLEADIINCDAYVVAKGGLKQLVKAPENISFYTFFNHTILHQATLIKTSLFTRVGLFNDSLKIVGDWEFFMRALFINNCTYEALPIVVSVFDTSGISSCKDNVQVSKEEREKILLSHYTHFIKDYRLMQPRPVYIFLGKIHQSNILLNLFVLSVRLFNRMMNLVTK